MWATGIWSLLSLRAGARSLLPWLSGCTGHSCSRGQWAPGGENHGQINNFSAVGGKPHEDRAAVAAMQDTWWYAMGHPKGPWRERVSTYGVHLDAAWFLQNKKTGSISKAWAVPASCVWFRSHKFMVVLLCLSSISFLTDQKPGSEWENDDVTTCNAWQNKEVVL